jgi:hypothetical protein
MIKLKRGDTLSENFLKTLGKLLKAPVFDAKTAYRIKKLKDAIFKEREETLSIYEKVGEEFAVKGEDGKPQRLPDTSWNVIPEKEEEFTKKWEELLNQEITIEQGQLEVRHLNQVQFSAIEIETLAPIISGLEEETPAKPAQLSAVKG